MQSKMNSDMMKNINLSDGVIGLPNGTYEKTIGYTEDIPDKFFSFSDRYKAFVMMQENSFAERIAEDPRNDDSQMRQLLEIHKKCPGWCDDCTCPSSCPCQKKDNDPVTPKIFRPTKQNMTGIADPSGYVYEAVASNRLPGVTVTAYMGGADSASVWDAAEYDQANPLVTDDAGQFAWDVPFGDWQVKAEKPGYDTNYSDWLPVPPPQTEVNIGMVSRAAPTVASVVGYTDCIETTFDKYMDTDTLTDANITLPGYAGGYTFSFVDAEQDPQNPDKTYARIVQIIPADPFAVGDTVAIAISTAAESYAGVGLASANQANVTIVPKPESVTSPQTVKLNYGETRTIKVSALPAEACADQKITAVSTSPYIAVVNAEAVTDETGAATFTVTGELSGAAELMFTLGDTRLTVTTTVTVALPGETVVDDVADADKVAADKAALTWDVIKGANTAQNNVISNLTLLGTGVNSSTITWSSSNKAVISDTGTVTRPTYGVGNQTVTLTATVTCGNATDTVTFTLTVIAQPYTSPYIPPATTTPPDTTVPDNNTPLSWSNPYTDVVDTDWFYAAVQYVTESGLMIGTAADKFSPGVTMTRAMLVTVLWRLEGKPEVEGLYADFADVVQGSWYEAAVGWAAKNEIVLGFPEGFFKPDDPVTREQAVTILYRYSEFKGLDVSASADLSKFTDMDDISDWALDAMKWAVAVGIIEGRTPTTTVPQGTSTRAEIAMIFKRYIEDYLGGQADEPEK